ncbi:ABC transporter permease [Bradyrhizobium sp. SYSU BS000235]|uniref:ABC transporter permease n=1 Tax=Bradyrhizobium sp. SYSU BS000235 TaxID=3411332 RepID=UPI003C707D91
MPILILRRILAAVPVVLIVITIVFALLRLTPGDPATVIAGDMASPETVSHIRTELGLDRPLYVQYGAWVADVVRGRLGNSIQSKKPVADLIAARLEPTFVLAFAAITLTVLIAVPLGALAAWYRGRWIDKFVLALSIGGFSIPAYVTGYILVLTLAIWADLFPSQGYVSPFQQPILALRHLFLPALTLSLVFVALIARVTRSSVLEILNEDFVRTARAKGASDRRILWRHALPNAAIPIVTVIGVGIAMLISGVVVTESVFNIPGIGLLTIDAILTRDYPVVQGLILFFALIFILINLLIDIVYVIVDPRIRY